MTRIEPERDEGLPTTTPGDEQRAELARADDLIARLGRERKALSDLDVLGRDPAQDAALLVPVIEAEILDRPAVADGRVKAPIPGLIARVLVAPGQAVETGQPLLVLEAMKMENELRAPRGGTVQAVKVKPGQTVTLGELMVEVA